MKWVAIISLILVNAGSAHAAQTTLVDLAPHFATNTEIIWKVATDRLPPHLWVYTRAPHIFSAAVISNAMVLASLESRGIPKPSTNDFAIWEGKGPNYPGPIPSIFYISPSQASINYGMPKYNVGSGEDIPGDKTLVRRSWKYALQFGLDPQQLVQEPPFSHVCVSDAEDGQNTNNQACGRGIFLSRQIDGIDFFSLRGDGEGAEGFWIEFGRSGKIRAFSLTWPILERYQIYQTVSPLQIMASIRAYKIFVLPEGGEDNYSARIKTLAKAKRLTITEIMPHYLQGVFGWMRADSEPPNWVTPVAELEAIADLGSTNAAIRILSPVLSFDAINALIK